jgi:hypothetical protein
MIGVEGAARDLIKSFALWNFDFMCVKIIFCFDITKDDRLRQDVGLSRWIYFMERLVKNL